VCDRSHLEGPVRTELDRTTWRKQVLHELGGRYAKAMDSSAEYGTAEALDDAGRWRESDEFFAQADREFGRKGV